MTAASTHLGDLIRVLDAFRPTPQELALIGELLTDDHSGRARPRRTGTPVPDDETAVASGTTERSRRLPAPVRRVRRTRTEAPRRRPSFLSDQAPWERTWWTAVVVLVLLLASLRLTGRIGGGAWLLVVLGLIAARPLLSNLSMSWRSPQRGSLAEQERGRSDGAGDDMDIGRVPLERASWRPPPEGRPLVQPGQQRAVATLLAGRSVPGEIDLVTTVRMVAARRPFTTVPRHLRWSTSLGLQLQVDMGPALEPYRDDVSQLRRALAAIASGHAVDEIGFDGDPRFVTWPRRTLGVRRRIRVEARLPVPGTPVLVLTDLGIALPRSGAAIEPRRFLEHHSRITQAGYEVHYLVPYPSDRWPSDLAELPIVYWSDDLGAFEVLTCIRRRRRAP